MRVREAIKVTLANAAGEDVEHTLPTKFEVCDRCRGNGTHTNPAIDGNGITQSEMAELGPEFQEDYFSGVYDVPCEVCEGLRVVPVVDEEKCSPELLAAYKRDQEEQAYLDRESAAERRMGA